MKSYIYIIIFLSFIFFQCKNGSDGKTKSSVKIDMPFKGLKKILYNSKSEPYQVCLREEYAYRFGDIEMHFEHSNIIELYSNTFNIPQSELTKLEGDSLKLEISKWYLLKDKVPDSLYSKIFKAEFSQEISDSLSFVTCNNMAKYTLRLINGKWKIIKKTGMDDTK